MKHTFKRTMTKKDIVPGMVVEFRNGIKAFAVRVETNLAHKEGIIFIESTGFMDLDSYDEDLLVYRRDYERGLKPNNWDIMKVYDTNLEYGLGVEGLLSNNNLKDFKLLWLREDKIEISLEDISKKFNIPIDQIRIKK